MVVYKGRVFSVETETFRNPDGRAHEIAIVRHSPSVVIVPMKDDDHVVMIRQYRHPIGREMWEIPAGSVDAGETPEAAAARECEEEIGLAPGRVEKLGAFYAVPGYCDELLVFFKAWDLRPPPPDSPRRPDDDEQIHPHVVSIAEAKAMLARGEIDDMKTAYGILTL